MMESKCQFSFLFIKNSTKRIEFRPQVFIVNLQRISMRTHFELLATFHILFLTQYVPGTVSISHEATGASGGEEQFGRDGT